MLALQLLCPYQHQVMHPCPSRGSESIKYKSTQKNEYGVLNNLEIRRYLDSCIQTLKHRRILQHVWDDHKPVKFLSCQNQCTYRKCNLQIQPYSEYKNLSYQTAHDWGIKPYKIVYKIKKSLRNIWFIPDFASSNKNMLKLRCFAILKRI